MIQLFFNGIISILASLIQIIVYPINAIIVSTLPDLSSKIIEVSNSISSLFVGATWGLGVLPHTLIVTLVFIISVEIAKYSIFISTHIISLILNIIRRIKFW